MHWRGWKKLGNPSRQRATAVIVVGTGPCSTVTQGVTQETPSRCGSVGAAQLGAAGPAAARLLGCRLTGGFPCRGLIWRWLGGHRLQGNFRRRRGRLGFLAEPAQ